MAYELRDGSGSLFRNEKKQPGERTPDYRGDAMVNGARVEIAAWVKESATGKKFLSLKFSEPREQTEAPRAAPAARPSPRPHNPTPDTDIPF